jgi:RNA recognition motif-containing protein
MEHKLYLTDLPYNISQTELENLLAQAGTVVSLQLNEVDLAEPFANRTAFAAMSSRLEAVRTINLLDGFRFKGNLLRLSEVATPGYFIPQSANLTSSYM